MSAPYGIVAEFERSDDLERAVARAMDAGYARIEVFGPRPMRSVAKMLGYRTTIIPWLALIAGLIGAATQYGAEYWMNAVDYPLNVGGRPLHSWPAFIPSTIIVAILWAGAATLIGLLLILRLPQLHHPMFDVPGFERASEDRFFLLIRGDDPAFEAGRSADFLKTLAARAVTEVSACR